MSKKDQPHPLAILFGLIIVGLMFVYQFVIENWQFITPPVIIVIILFWSLNNRTKKANRERHLNFMNSLRNGIETEILNIARNGFHPYDENRSIKLKKGETLLGLYNSSWFEYRKQRTGKFQAQGFTYRLKIAPGLNYRLVSGQYDFQSDDVLKQIETGDLYVTNSRIVLTGQQSTKSLLYGKILNLELFFNQYSRKNNPQTYIRIRRETGKDVFLEFQPEYDFEFVSTLLIAFHEYHGHPTSKELKVFFEED